MGFNSGFKVLSAFYTPALVLSDCLYSIAAIFVKLYTVFAFHLLSFTFLNICICKSQNGFPETKPHI